MNKITAYNILHSDVLYNRLSKVPDAHATRVIHDIDSLINIASRDDFLDLEICWRFKNA